MLKESISETNLKIIDYSQISWGQWVESPHFDEL